MLWGSLKGGSRVPAGLNLPGDGQGNLKGGLPKASIGFWGRQITHTGEEGLELQSKGFPLLHRYFVPLKRRTGLFDQVALLVHEV